MLPIVFEWNWELGRLIFMGLLYLVLIVVAIGLVTAFCMTVKDFQAGKGGHHGQDHESPAEHPAQH